MVSVDVPNVGSELMGLVSLEVFRFIRGGGSKDRLIQRTYVIKMFPLPFNLLCNHILLRRIVDCFD